MTYFIWCMTRYTRRRTHVSRKVTRCTKLGGAPENLIFPALMNTSSKHKQHLYEKFLIKRNQGKKPEYKNYKILFEAVKKYSKNLHFSKLILTYKDNTKKTCWEFIKESIRKEKCRQQNFL